MPRTLTVLAVACLVVLGFAFVASAADDPPIGEVAVEEAEAALEAPAVEAPAEAEGEMCLEPAAEPVLMAKPTSFCPSDSVCNWREVDECCCEAQRPWAAPECSLPLCRC